MNKTNKKRFKIAVAMSGGLDSSVAAAILKKQGYDVIGIFMRLSPQKSFYESEARARKVAEILNIPFYVFDFEKEFKKGIIKSFLKEYKMGITPNPCVLCNKEMKFGLLLEKILSLNIDFIATGHYARLRREIVNSKSEIKKYKYQLLKAKDKYKDQSYFLWRLSQKQLKRILFPIGNYTRREVENLAKKFKFDFLLKIKKSTEICFVLATTNDFLKNHLKENPGKIVDTKEKILGEHQGLWFYTIGQRKGIRLASGPYYVLDKDIKNNLLIVTKNEKDLYKKELIVKDVNWTLGRKPKMPIQVMAKIRYRHKSSPATICHFKSNKYYLKFDLPQRAPAPGQSAVFYSCNNNLKESDELIGGGIIC